jgi:flagellar M-ring protein FliF
MGFLNQTFEQIRDLFASMTPAARITSALLLGVIVCSMGFLFQGYSNASEEPLFGGALLQPAETRRIETALGQAGLDILELNQGRIMVPRGQKAAYLAAIANAGALPANFHNLLEDSLETGMFESGKMRDQRWKAARERQISMMISEWEGIEDAKVLYDIREPRAFGKEEITATVSVMPSPGAIFDPQRMKLIREAVAKSIAGLRAESVMVVDRSNGSQYGGIGGEVGAAAFDDPYFQTRTLFEQQMRSRIEALLSDIKPGVRVQVTAELDDTLSSETRSVRPDGESTPLRERKSTEESVNRQTEGGGQVGLRAQGPNRQTPEQAGVRNENTTASEDTETDSFVPHIEEVRRQSGLTPKHVRAAIAVPSEYLIRVWRETTPDAKPEDRPDVAMLTNIEEQVKSKIKATVGPLFPKELAEDQLTKVEVTVFQSLTPAPTPEPSVASEGVLWAKQNTSSLIIAGMALMSLLMLRSMIKSIPTTDKGVDFSLPDILPKKNEAAKASGKGGESEGGRPKLRLKRGPSLKEDLSELVKEDPDGAAAILRTWIGNAG